MNSANHENIAILLSQTFNEMLVSISSVQELSINSVDKKIIQNLEFKTIICSIAAATFKMNMLVHFPVDNKAMNNFIQLIDSNTTKNTKEQYIDYISEKVNNLCGAVNRVLGLCGFSSGMSTPVTLYIPNSTLHMDSVGPKSEAHIGCFFNGEPLIFASLYLIINHGYENKFVLTVPSVNSESESSGELEFF